MNANFLSPALRSNLEEVSWPAFPGPIATLLLAQLFQLELSQWWSPEQLRARQLQQFASLAKYACAQSEFYRTRFAEVDLDRQGPWSEKTFRSLPLLTRTELLTKEARISCQVVPASHGPVGVAQTSGSTGQVVAVKRSGLCEIFWFALNMRDHLWHRRDFSQALACIRGTLQARHDHDDAKAGEMGWGPPATVLLSTGPGYFRPISTDVDALAEWLLQIDPAYLLIYPTSLNGLLTRFQQYRRTPRNLRQVRTVGETVSPELRMRCREVLGVPIVDCYSSQEVGAIAVQCPQSDLYHVHAESLIVEVLDEQGRQCQPGEVGRVVVTDLHNFATPLIRYELRYHAEVGMACPCGRGLPTLVRILGRQRNMVVLPTGQRHWPQVGLGRYREIGPILQFQAVQHSVEEVEMRLVTGGGPLRPQQEQRLREVIVENLGHPFAIRFTYFQGELPRTRNGKFEEFVCLIGS